MPHAAHAQATQRDRKVHKLPILSKLILSVHTGAHQVSLAGTGRHTGICLLHPVSLATVGPAVSVNTIVGKSLPDQTPARRPEKESNHQ